MLDVKKQSALLGVCLGVFGCFTFMAFVAFYLKSNEIHEVEYDVNTVTAGDYTVEMEINKKMWNKFKDSEYFSGRKADGISPGQAFEDYLIDTIQHEMSHLNDGRPEHKKFKNEKTTVASVQLAFDNAKVIGCL
jgi:hypothetical protein